MQYKGGKAAVITTEESSQDHVQQAAQDEKFSNQFEHKAGDQKLDAKHEPVVGQPVVEHPDTDVIASTVLPASALHNSVNNTEASSELAETGGYTELRDIVDDKEDTRHTTLKAKEYKHRSDVSKVDGQTRRTLCQDFTRWYTHDWSFPHRGMPGQHKKEVRLGIMFKALWQNSDFTWNTAWPLTLMGLLAHDVYCFYTQERYGNTLTKIFAGLPIADIQNYWRAGASNQATWSNNLGSDLVADYRYWLGIGAAIGIPLLNRVWQWYRQSHWAQPFSKEHNYSNYENELTTGSESNFWQNTGRWLFPLISHDYKLARLEFAVIHDGEVSENNRNYLFDLIQTVAVEHRQLARWRALGAAANIAYNFDRKDNVYFTPLNQLNPTVKQNIKALQVDALSLLYDFADGEYTTIEILRANYLLWSIGHNQNAAWNVVFWPLVLYVQYAKIRLLELILQKARGAYEYFKAQQTCHNENNVWQYQPQIADYACTVCGNFSFVYYRDANNVQACLDALLAQPQQQPSQFFFGNISYLLKHPGITRIDLTQQNWWNWFSGDFQNFLNYFINAPAPIQSLMTFNLSTAAYNTQWLDNTQLSMLVNFFRAIPTIQIDMHNIGIGFNGLKILMPGLTCPNVTTEYVDLSGNNLNDDGAITIADNLPQMPRLKQLLLSNNGITNFGLPPLGSALKNTVITLLDVSDNLFTDPGMLNFSSSLPYTFLQTLDISFNTLTVASMSTLGRGIAPSLIKTLRMAGCNLGADEITVLSPYIKTSRVQSLDVSYNPIGDTGVTVLFENLPNSAMMEVNLGNCQIGDMGITNMVTFIPYTQLQMLLLPANSFSTDGFARLTAVFSNSTLAYINVASNNLGDEGAITFSLVPFNNTRMRGFDLSDNDITDIGGIPLINSLDGSHIVIVNLASNLLTGATAYRLTEILQRLALVYLNLNDNQINNGSVRALAKVLIGSLLQTLLLNENPLQDEDAEAIFENLITPIPEITDITEQQLSIDETRALAHASNQTQITTLGLNNDQLNTPSAFAACHAWQQISAPIDQLQLGQNNINSELIDTNTCQISAATRTTPSANMILMMFSGIIILYVLDILASSARNIISGCTQTFFGSCRKNPSETKKEFNGSQSNSLVNAYNASGLLRPTHTHLINSDRNNANTHVRRFTH